jgi:hypothetical protein
LKIYFDMVKLNSFLNLFLDLKISRIEHLF